MTVKRLATAGALSLGLVFAASANAQVIEWTSGQMGGGWYTQSSGLANIIQEKNPDLKIRVVPGGGTANPTKVDRNTSQLGTGLDIFTYAASQGKFLYEGKPHKKLRMIGMSFSDLPVHIVGAKGNETNLRKLFTQDKDVKFAVTKAGSSDEQTFRYLMAYYGTSYDELRNKRGWKINHADYSEMASQFADGQVDYAFAVLGAPGAAIIEMTGARKSEILPWPDDVIQHMVKTYGYQARTLEKDVYPAAMEGPVPVILMATTLMTNSDVPEETIYKITKTLCESRDKFGDIHQSMTVFDCKTAWKNSPAPLHAGAARYYREAGYMK